MTSENILQFKLFYGVFVIIAVWQNNIFWSMLVNTQFTVAIDFHSMEKNTMEVNGYRKLFGYQHT